MFQSLVRPLKMMMPKKGYRKVLFGPAAGCVMEIDPRQRIRPYLGVHEWELNGYFKRLVTPGSKCFDLGGNDGYDALMIATLSRGKVASFECDPSTAITLRQNIAQNPKLDICVVESFVGSESDTLTQNHPGMIIEVHGLDKEQRCLAILRDYGYSTSIVNQSWFMKDSARGGYNRWLVASRDPRSAAGN